MSHTSPFCPTFWYSHWQFNLITWCTEREFVHSQSQWLHWGLAYLMTCCKIPLHQQSKAFPFVTPTPSHRKGGLAAVCISWLEDMGWYGARISWPRKLMHQQTTYSYACPLCYHTYWRPGVHIVTVFAAPWKVCGKMLLVPKPPFFWGCGTKSILGVRAAHVLCKQKLIWKQPGPWLCRCSFRCWPWLLSCTRALVLLQHRDFKLRTA